MDGGTGTRRGGGVPPSAGWATGPLGAVQAADREIARQTALRARAVAEFAASRPASADRPAGQPGCMSAARRAARAAVLTEVSEWAAQELVVALAISAEAAEALLVRSLTLVHRLPATLAALESGALHAGHLWPLLDKLAPIADDGLRAAVEAELLAWAAGRVCTPAQLAAKARRTLLARDAHGAAQRLAAAVRSRGVWARPDREAGMSAFGALLTTPEARALLAALGRYADAVADEPGGPPRTRGQKMADCLLDLVLRPGECGLAPVQVQLTVVASAATLAGGDAPGEIDGEPVPAEMVRALARALGLLPAADSGGPDPQADPGGPAADRAPADDGGAPAGGPGARSSGDPSAGVGLAPEPVPDVGFDPYAETEQRELQRWWDAMEARVLSEQWGGADSPPLEQLAQTWADEGWADEGWADQGWADQGWADQGWADQGWADEAWADEAWADEAWADEAGHDRAAVVDGGAAVGGEDPPESGGTGVPGGAGSGAAGVGWWATADRAVADAGAALLDLQRAVGRARRAVADAERAERADERAWRTAAAGRVSVAGDTIAALAEAGAAQRAALAGLLDATAGGGLVERPRIAVVDALSGALLALTDGAELRRRSACAARACRRAPARCGHDLTGRPGLRPPPVEVGYRPGAPLDRWVRARDRRCRFPGCRRRVPRGGELDHDRPWPDGPTSAANLAGYCTPHHRGKHQAPGWRHALAPDGTLTVHTPTGLITTTTPPPY